MEFYVLNKNFQREFIIEAYTSLIWNDRYYEAGDFEITAPFNQELYYYFQRFDTYIWNSESEHLMMIESVEVTTDVEVGNIIKVSGRSAEASILDRRIIWNRTIADGKFQNAIEKILNENVINPSDPNRRIPNIVYKRTSDSYIESLYVNKQEVGETVYETIMAMCQAVNVGFKLSYTNDDNKLVFELYYGVDRSTDQYDRMGVIFSPDFDNLINSSFINAYNEYRNVALVAGEGEGADQKFYTAGATSVSGLDRREMFVDGSDISSLIKPTKTETDTEDKKWGDSVEEQLNDYRTKLNQAVTRRSEIEKLIPETRQQLNDVNSQKGDYASDSAEYYDLIRQENELIQKLYDYDKELQQLEGNIPLYQAKLRELEGERNDMTPGGEDDQREQLYAEKLKLEQQISAIENQIDSLRDVLPDMYKKRVEVKKELDSLQKEYNEAITNKPKLEAESALAEEQIFKDNSDAIEYNNRLIEVENLIRDWESEHGQTTTDATIKALQNEKATKEKRLQEIAEELQKLEHPENPNKPGSTTNAFDSSSIYKEYSNYLDKKSASEEKIDKYAEQLEEAEQDLADAKKALADADPGSIDEDQAKLDVITAQKEMARLERLIDEEEMNLIDIETKLEELKKKLDAINPGSDDDKREALYKEQYEINLRLDIIEEQLSLIDGTQPQFYQEKIDLRKKIESLESNIKSNQEKLERNKETILKYDIIIRDYPPRISDLEKQLRNLNSQADDAYSNDYIQSVNDEIDRLEAQKDSLEKQVDDMEDIIRNFENPKKEEEEEKHLSDAEYNTLLLQRGLEELSQKRTTFMFDGKVEPKIQYEYGVDFFVGDVVQLQNEYGNNVKVRITEYIISQDANGMEAYPTFVAITT